MNNLIFSLVLSLASFFLGTLFSEKKPGHRWGEKEKAFKECIAELSNKCSSTIEYAIMLENENAKLNKNKKNCNNQ